MKAPHTFGPVALGLIVTLLTASSVVHAESSCTSTFNDLKKRYNTYAKDVDRLVKLSSDLEQYIAKSPNTTNVYSRLETSRLQRDVDLNGSGPVAPVKGRTKEQIEARYRETSNAALDPVIRQLQYEVEDKLNSDKKWLKEPGGQVPSDLSGKNFNVGVYTDNNQDDIDFNTMSVSVKQDGRNLTLVTTLYYGKDATPVVSFSRDIGSGHILSAPKLTQEEFNRKVATTEALIKDEYPQICMQRIDSNSGRMKKRDADDGAITNFFKTTFSTKKKNYYEDDYRSYEPRRAAVRYDSSPRRYSYERDPYGYDSHNYDYLDGGYGYRSSYRRYSSGGYARPSHYLRDRDYDYYDDSEGGFTSRIEDDGYDDYYDGAL